ncbi:MAG: two pore domain potassium channel family protein [Algoriphagus sp.]|uniref:potassium channel family protein n=1 Tax=Algoriphagus sp. TaxID=1872435 RepID=UPI001810CD93|nr:potassium channel family protein [Algoriphagus sp.]NVJ87597.1 two pore domain potassium channel family protein [Algoriphagus sp.]
MAYAMRNEFSTNLSFLRNDTLFVKKKLFLTNIYADWVNDLSSTFVGGFYKISFKEEVFCVNCIFDIYKSTFQKRASFALSTEKEQIEKNYYGRAFYPSISYQECIFRSGGAFNYYQLPPEELIKVQASFNDCKFYSEKGGSSPFGFTTTGISSVQVSNSQFLGEGKVRLATSHGEKLIITNNDFDQNYLQISLNSDEGFSDLEISNNSILRPCLVSFNEFKNRNVIDWSQFKNGIIDFESSLEHYQAYYQTELTEALINWNSHIPDSAFFDYLENYRIQNKKAYQAEISLRGQLKQLYDQKHNTENSNAVFIQMKNLETERLEYLHQQNPTFDTFFKWKVNQFLKLFSAYGTEPSRAITMSVYVVIAFALIYLFFPNHWDSHGKNRIMDRYRFFAKYMKKDSGIHEVYLDEKREEMIAAEDFRAYMLESKQEIPGFFMATALPLYRWSVAGTRTFSWLLSKVDVLKGTWSSTEDSKKAGKSVLIIGAFLIAIVYDLFIKMLNALMLSINTFTTLGFGEIPIKGLPRYLAIIQGFIGWFMLTIFSVSLISQLLN